MKYAEKLRHPLWQKKRLEILSRDEFCCTLCGDHETELHIHHKEYKRGSEPWEYEDSVLQTLCKHCHALVENLKTFSCTPLVVAKNNIDESGELVAISCIHSIHDGRRSASFFYYSSSSNTFFEITMLSAETYGKLQQLIQLSEKL